MTETAYDRWGRPRPTKPRPPEATPEFRAKIAAMRKALAECDGRDDGLNPCPACEGTKGVHLIRGAGLPGESSRLQRAVCPCGRKGPIRYGTEAARKAWNELERGGGAPSRHDP